MATRITLLVLASLVGCATGGHPTPDAIYRHPVTGDVQWCDRPSGVGMALGGVIVGRTPGWTRRRSRLPGISSDTKRRSSAWTRQRLTRSASRSARVEPWWLSSSPRAPPKGIKVVVGHGVRRRSDVDAITPGTCGFLDKGDLVTVHTQPVRERLLRLARARLAPCRSGPRSRTSRGWRGRRRTRRCRPTRSWRS